VFVSYYCIIFSAGRQEKRDRKIILPPPPLRGWEDFENFL